MPVRLIVSSKSECTTLGPVADSTVDDDFQAEGWTTEELLPLMRKHETYQRASQNREIHGTEGPIKVSFGNYT